MKIYRLLAGIILILCGLGTYPLLAQDGDLIPGGPGENNAISAVLFYTAPGREDEAAQRRDQAEEYLQVISDTTPQLYNAFLITVPDVQVETLVGYLPGLPRLVKGVYRNDLEWADRGVEWPDVRVIWPSPEDNSQVLVPGTYTVTGKVDGTNIQPKATVTVRSGVEPPSPDGHP